MFTNLLLFVIYGDIITLRCASLHSFIIWYCTIMSPVAWLLYPVINLTNHCVFSCEIKGTCSSLLLWVYGDLHALEVNDTSAWCNMRAQISCLISARKSLFRRQFTSESNPSISRCLFGFTSVCVMVNEDVICRRLGVVRLRSEANRLNQWPEHHRAKRIRGQAMIIYRFSARKIRNDNATFSVKIDHRADSLHKNATSTPNCYVVKTRHIINVWSQQLVDRTDTVCLS